MSENDELIRELCPDGVEYKKLSDCASIERGKRVTKNELNPNEFYPVYSGGVTPMGYFSKSNQPANTITIVKYGTAGFVNFIKEDFWANDVCYCVKPNDFLNNKFLFYVLKAKQKYIQSQVTDAIPAHLPTEVIGSITIPIPPPEVQKEIVNILDKFTQLEAELSAELEARRRQYEFYRNKLFAFDESRKDFKWSTLGGISRKVSSGGTPLAGSAAYYHKGTIPWLRTNEVKFNEISTTEMLITEEAVRKTSAKWIPEKCVIIAISGATAGRSAINKIPMATNQHCCNLEIDSEQANYKYIYYWVAANHKNIKSLGRGARSDLNSALIKGFRVPVPSLAEQNRIVAILDRFDALVNDISSGLPAEIAARRKQYEYYRTKLLTFQEIK